MGFALALASSFCWSIATVLIKKLKDIPSMQLLAWVSVLVVPMLFVLSFLFEPERPPILQAPLSALLGLAYTALFSTIAAYGSWYFLISRYTAPIERVEELVAAHRAYLEEQYARGLFVVSGRREPWTGGVIIARGARDEIEAAVAADPFTVEGVAETEIVEWLVLFGRLGE